MAEDIERINVEVVQKVASPLLNNDELKSKLNSPKVIEVDGQKIEQHDLSELIEADRYFSGKIASRKRGFGLRFAKLESSGSVR